MSKPSREQLIYWLIEAAEIEHHLMCCYLYAAFSLKRQDPRWTPAQAAAVERWRALITGVAYEEMSHLCLVGNLFNALGAPSHMTRPPLPVESGPYPAGFVIRLAPFCEATIEHFQYLERPTGVDLEDGQGFDVPKTYRRHVPLERLSPGARDYETVGELYETLADSLKAFADETGERALFIGDPRLQVDAALAPLPGVAPITDLRSALAAIDTIVTQGEGAGASNADSHFARFSRVLDELRSERSADPAFEPAWPAATNPVMNPPVKAVADRVHVDHPQIARWLDIGNSLYTTSLRCLLQGFGDTDRVAKANWLGASFALMRALVPVGQGLAARPAHADVSHPHAGLTFTPLRSLAALPRERAAHFVAERLDQLRQRALELPVVPVDGESGSTWTGVIAMLAKQRERMDTLCVARPAAEGASEATPAPNPAAAAAPTPEPASASPVETVAGKDIVIHFEGRRCIHSRHCVLEAPMVFKANTPGDWILPDALDVAALVAVAHNCPSGAIRYDRLDGQGAEPPPPVNTLRLRENGPYAFHAPLTVAHAADGLRATLCRCGQSSRKPWCDGSHVAAEFKASGEPPTGNVDPLGTRDGTLEVTPLLDGPLLVRGNLEICAGTGRTVARVTEARLCRCGQSRNKPFCDLSHAGAGFVAAGD